MQLTTLTPKKSLNKAYLKVKPLRAEFDCFKANLRTLLERIHITESEEFHKNLIIDFLKNTYYDPQYLINTKGRTDLVIYNGAKLSSSVGVIFETKKPTNSAEMLSFEKGNVKALQELVLYYLRERITHNNLEVRHLVVTNSVDWFIFDAVVFDRLFAQNKAFVQQFIDFESGRLADTKTDFFYKQLAEPFIDRISTPLECTYLNFRQVQDLLERGDDSALIAVFKLFSPEHLLKRPFANDSNRLDKRFYGELLHIIGLTESKVGSKKLIGRNPPDARHSGTLIEEAMIQLDSLKKLSRLPNPRQFGSEPQEQIFAVALELSITWINRILFLKLLEAQLLTYHHGDPDYAFLNSDTLKCYGQLNRLFFQVLARQHDQRHPDVKTAFSKVPYLNSSLFEPTDLEQITLFISNLTNHKTVPIFAHTVLKDALGNKRSGELSTLDYLFQFLNAYDFSSEGKEEIQENNKTLINAAVLGLIFEKINGYQDGSFFTPGFITMYMCRETIRNAVIQKFNTVKQWNCKTIEDLYDAIEDRSEANQIINSLKICDPAVGSGHFLVSALNELIAIKHDLKILQDRDGKRLKEYQIEVVNDELIITDDDGELFEYHPNNKERQRLQEALFHEKQMLIEQCLFGVDINDNSVKICRLRLWIELLKNAYYKNATELETFPNIDINIKCGNSLVSRFALDADLKQALQKNQRTIEDYRLAVDTYRNANNSEQKSDMQRLIADIKADFRSEIFANDPQLKKLITIKNELYMLTRQQEMLEMSKKDQAVRDKKITQLIKEIKQIEAEIEETKSNTIFENAFEWRFEFPEVLNDDGDFIGFDVVIGNPPYGIKFNESEKHYFKSKFYLNEDIYTLFIELGINIVRKTFYVSLINPITWLTGVKYKKTRSLFVSDMSLIKAINLPYDIFPDAYVDTGIYFFQKMFNDETQAFEFNTKEKIQLESFNKINFKIISRKNWINRQDLKINLNELYGSIFLKLDSFSNKISDFCETARGILADNKNYKNQPSTNCKQVFTGKLNRYAIDNIFQFIEYNDTIKEKPNSYMFFVGERILVRRIISRQFRIMATITDREFVCKKDIYIIKINDDAFNYKYVLALLNSSLLSFYKTNNSGSAKKDDFTQITLGDIRQLPIPKIEDIKQKPFIHLVEKILSKKMKDINANTTNLESQIDQLVYQLYGLTAEEIQIVENATTSKGSDLMSSATSESP